MTRARTIANIGDGVTAADITDATITAAKMAEGAVEGAMTTQIGGRRNLIINGAMQVAQRGTSATGVGGYIAVDRFRCTGSADAVDQLSLTHAQVADAPNGFAYSYKITVSTAETALAVNEMIRIEQRMEGQNLQHLKKGTSSAEAVTLSFWIKGSVTGTYIVNLHDTDNTRTIAASYTINAANTWEYKTITFAGDTTGALDNDNSQSLSLYWYLGAGTDWTSGTLGTSWAAFTKANVAVGQTDILTTSSATWQITGVQLEVGDTATPFEHRSYGEELALCQRYCETFTRYGEGLSTNANNLVLSSRYSSSSALCHVWFRTTKRTSTPDVTYSVGGTSTDQLYGKSNNYFAVYDPSDVAFYLYEIIVEDEL